MLAVAGKIAVPKKGQIEPVWTVTLHATFLLLQRCGVGAVTEIQTYNPELFLLTILMYI